jgi:SAM-dependent methyltransferase
MISPTQRGIHEANRASWNAATIAHNSHKSDQIRFFRDGGDTLFPEEVALLGDLDGRRLLHLQCNCGQDSLSLARRGARVTGVDIADQAIDFARHLSMRTQIPADFQRGDLYDWLEDQIAAGATFDRVFSSYGALLYLSSLDLWAAAIATLLRPGGRLVLVDFHPVVHMFDRAGNLRHPYTSGGKPLTGSNGVRDYVAQSGSELAAGEFHHGIRDFTNPYPHHVFCWGLGELITAVLAAGMTIEVLHEYGHANGRRHFAAGRIGEGRRALPPEHLPNLPMMFGLSAVR